MSSMKTAQLWDIDNDVTITNTDGVETLQAKSMYIHFQHPKQSQIICKSESIGSLSGNLTSVLNGTITTRTPKKHHTIFDIEVSLNGNKQNLKVEATKNKSSECVVS
jgi:hypothetical protein